MSLRCKAGDLAIIINGIRPHVLGMECEVISYVHPGTDQRSSIRGDLFELTTEPAWYVMCSNGIDAVLYDDDLLPIRPDSLPIETTTSTGEPA